MEQPSLLKAHLKFSKCDQFGKGINTFVGSTSNEICPILACLAYITVQGSSPGPFFCLEDGSPLTKAMFVSQVRGISSQAGLDASLYASHSFRRGAAMSAAQAHTVDSVITEDNGSLV